MKFAILQSTILDYRLGFYRLLKEKYGDALTICAGVSNADPNQRTPDSVWAYTNRVNNYYFFGGRLLWQVGAFSLLKNQPLVIVDANLRFISTALLVIYRYCKGLPTVAWGHAEGQSNFGKWIRKYYFKFFSSLIAYTESQKHYLQEKHPNVPVWSAFNACLRQEDCFAPDVEIQEYTDFIFVGRLSADKKPKLLFDAFIKAVQSSGLPKESRLIFIGEGPIRAELMQRVAEFSLEERVTFTGAIHETDLLRNYYRRAIAAVSPGYVGLSVTQACSFGVPMLVARDEPHSPEIEVCREGFNSRFFASDNIAELANVLAHFYKERKFWYSQRQQIAEDTRERYSFEKMSQTFVDVITYFDSQI
jgi:glycosyltransferase involved in cell wall biosynthesis